MSRRLPPTGTGRRLFFHPNRGAPITRTTRGRTAGAIVPAGVLLLGAALLLPTTAWAPPHRALVAMVVTNASDLLDGPGAVGQTGDILIANDVIAFVIEAVDHPHGACLSGGHVIDGGAAPDWYDELGQSVTILDSWPRQAVYDTVRVAGDGSGGEAVVLAVGTDSGNPNLRVTTRYSLEAGDAFMTVVTEISSSGGAVTGYRAGDAVTWGNTLHFLPGYGFDVSWTSSYTEWLGGKGTTTCYGYAVASGAFYSTHGSTWSDPLPFEGDIPAGGTVSFTRYLIAREPDLASVSDIVHGVRGTATGTLTGRVTDETTGDPVPGAVLDIGVTATAPYTQAVAGATGLYQATLPPVSFVVTASAEDYLEGDVNASVVAGQTVEADVMLRPDTWEPTYGDTLTVIMRPLLSVAAIRTPGSTFVIEALAPGATTAWQASLTRGAYERSLALTGVSYVVADERWYMTATVPAGTPAELYDLRLRASDGIDDTAAHAVAVRDSIDDTFYVVQITDTHTPTHRYWYQSGADTDTTELDDLRAMIEDINLMNPDFVIHTGDLVNEGELEDFMGRRYFTRAQRVLEELTVPLIMVPGNHDIGGWDDTPPPAGNSRRAWWRFFGWRQLGDPPPGDPRRTQDYSFDHGGVHFVGLEAYDNYDSWRYPIYGAESFTDDQMTWLADDLGLADPAAPKVLFYHYDFAGELNLQGLGITCALWGHIHRTSGSLGGPPYNLSLDCGCDGHRGMRVVKIEDGVVLPQAPIVPGASGQRLRVTYAPANDGTSARVTATIVNEQAQSFADGLLRFAVTADSIPYKVDNGVLRQTIVEGATAVCYVAVPISASGITSVAVSPGPRPEPPITRVTLFPASPNPSRTTASVRYALPAAANVRLEVFDLSGRRVATLAEGPTEPGQNEAVWDLTGTDGRRVTSGIYFLKLEAGDESVTGKIVVVK